MIEDFIPDRPDRSKLPTTIRSWFRDWLYLFQLIFTPYERHLKGPRRSIKPNHKLTDSDQQEALAYAKELAGEAQKRFQDMRARGFQLLAVIGLVSPLLGWALLNSAGDIEGNWKLTILFSACLAGSFVALSIVAFFRTQKRISSTSPAFDVVINLATSKVCKLKTEELVVTYLQQWGELNAWADLLFDFVRAGMRVCKLRIACRNHIISYFLFCAQV